MLNVEYAIPQRSYCMEDADLVRLCQNGDMAAFEQLFHKYQERVYGTALRMMSNKEDALDLTQEIFLKAYQNIHKFKSTSAFSTWLYRLSVNLCIDELRKRKRFANTVPLEEAVSQADANTPEDYAISKERERQVWKALNSLKEKERAIIILRDMEGLSYKEIAEVFRCSLGRVKSRLHEARQSLKAILETETDLWADLPGDA
jgi:RNA polymerase sigma-70 factor (ECF subfamily)